MGKYFPKIPKIAPGQPGHGAMHQFLRRGPAPAPTATSAATAPATSAADPPSPPPTSAPTTTPSGASLSLPSVPSTSTDTRVDVHRLLDAPSASHASNALDALNAPSDAELRVSHSTPIPELKSSKNRQASILPLPSAASARPTTKLRGSPYDRPITKNANNDPVPALSFARSTKKRAPIIISDDEDDRMVIKSTTYASASLSKTTTSPSSTLLTLPSPIDSVFPITPGSTLQPLYPNEGETIKNDGETPESELDIASSKLDKESAADADDEASDDDDDEMEEDEDGEVFWDAMDEAEDGQEDEGMEDVDYGGREENNGAENEAPVQKQARAETPLPPVSHKRARLSPPSNVVPASYSPATASGFYAYREASSSINHPTGSRYAVLDVDPLPDEDDTIANPSPEARQIPSLEPPIAAINDAEDDAEMANGDSNKEENAEVKSESKKAKRKGQNMRRRVKLRASASLLSSSEHSDGNSLASFVCSSSNLEGDSDDSNNSNDSDDADDSFNNSDDSASSSSSLSSSTSSRSPSPVRKNRKTRVQKDKNQRAKNRRKEKARRLASTPSSPPSHSPPAPPPSTQSSSSAPITYTSKGKARIPMSTNPKNVARRGTKAEAFSEAARQKREAAAATLKSKIIPFDQSTFAPQNDGDSLATILLKSHVARDWWKQTQASEEDIAVLAAVESTTLDAMAAYACDPVGFNPAEWPDALELVTLGPGDKGGAIEMVSPYTRQRFTTRSKLSTIMDGLDKRAPQDAVHHDAIRQVIARSKGLIGENYNGISRWDPELRYLYDLADEKAYTRIKQRTSVEIEESVECEDLIECADSVEREPGELNSVKPEEPHWVFGVWRWKGLVQVIPKEDWHLTATQIHSKYRRPSIFEGFLVDCGRGGVCYNATPGGEFGPWYAGGYQSFWDLMEKIRTAHPQPDLEPVPSEMTQELQKLVRIQAKYAKSQGVRLPPEFQEAMTAQLMPSGTTAAGSVPSVVISKDSTRSELKLINSFWGEFPGKGPRSLRWYNDMVNGRVPPNVPQALDAEAIAEQRLSGMNLWYFGEKYKSPRLAAHMLFICRYIYITNPQVLVTHSEPVFHLLYYDYGDLTECPIAQKWVKNPPSVVFEDAMTELELYWSRSGITSDPKNLGNTYDYSKNVGERFISMVGTMRQPVFVERDYGAEQRLTVTCRQEEYLHCCTSGMRWCIDYLAHEVTGEPDERDHEGFMTRMDQFFDEQGLQEMARGWRNELYEVRGAYAVLQQSARSQRETDAADALGPQERAAFDYGRSAGASHGYQMYTARSPRVAGAPNSKKRRAQADQFVERFKDCHARNVAPPLDLPRHLNPLYDEDAFRAWHKARVEGKLLWRAAHAAQGWAGSLPEVLARKTHIAEEGRKYAKTRTLLKTVGSFTRAVTSKVALQLLSLFDFSAPRLGESPDKALRAIACPNCPNEPLAYGTPNTLHQCANVTGSAGSASATTKATVSTNHLYHTNPVTPHNLLLHDPKQPELLAWAQSPESGLCVESIDKHLPNGIDLPAAKEKHAGVFCIHHDDQLGHPDLPRFMEYQAVIAFIIEHHTHSLFDEFWPHFTGPKLAQVLKAMRSPEEDEVIVVTDRCEGSDGRCPYRVIDVVPEAEAAVGLRLQKQHSERGNRYARPPLQYLPHSYAEATLARTAPLKPKRPADGKRDQSGKCIKAKRARITHRLQCFWDLPLTWKIRAVSALYFSQDAYHEFLAGWTITDLLNWKQSE